MKCLFVTEVSFSKKHFAYWNRVRNLAEALASNGHTVEIVQYLTKPNWAPLKGLSKLPGVSERIVHAPRPIPITSVTSTLLRNGLELVQASGLTSATYSLQSKLLGVPFVYDMHGRDDLEVKFAAQHYVVRHTKSKVLGIISKGVLTLSNLVLCASRTLAESIHNARTVYVPNAVDLERFGPPPLKVSDAVKRQLGLNDRFVFGYVGGGQQYQGLSLLIDSFKRLSQTSAMLLIIGPRLLRPAVNVVTVPWISSEDVPKYISAFDVAVLPRPLIPLNAYAAPTKFTEYAAIGKPILATPIGDPAVYVQKYNCGIVTKDDRPSSIYETMLGFLDLTSVELEDMGKRANRLAHDVFDRVKVNERYVEALGRLQLE